MSLRGMYEKFLQTYTVRSREARGVGMTMRPAPRSRGEAPASWVVSVLGREERQQRGVGGVRVLEHHRMSARLQHRERGPRDARSQLLGVDDRGDDVPGA